MDVKVVVDEYTVQQLYDAYSEQGGVLSKDDFAQAAAQNIIERYYGVEYFDISNIRQDFD